MTFEVFKNIEISEEPPVGNRLFAASIVNVPEFPFICGRTTLTVSELEEAEFKANRESVPGVNRKIVIQKVLIINVYNGIWRWVPTSGNTQQFIYDLMIASDCQVGKWYWLLNVISKREITRKIR